MILRSRVTFIHRTSEFISIVMIQLGQQCCTQLACHSTLLSSCLLVGLFVSWLLIQSSALFDRFALHLGILCSPIDDCFEAFAEESRLFSRR